MYNLDNDTDILAFLGNLTGDNFSLVTEGTTTSTTTSLSETETFSTTASSTTSGTVSTSTTTSSATSSTNSTTTSVTTSQTLSTTETATTSTTRRPSTTSTVEQISIQVSSTNFIEQTHTSTTTSSRAPAAIIRGGMAITVRNEQVQLVIRNPAVRLALKESIASLAAVPPSYVEVSFVVLNRRRLSALQIWRRLGTASVSVDYVITLPDEEGASITATSVGDALRSTTPDEMTDLVKTAVDKNVGHEELELSVSEMNEPTVEWSASTTEHFLPPLTVWDLDPGDASDIGDESAGNPIAIIIGFTIVAIIAVCCQVLVVVWYLQKRRKSTAVGNSMAAEQATAAHSSTTKVGPSDEWEREVRKLGKAQERSNLLGGTPTGTGGTACSSRSGTGALDSPAGSTGEVEMIGPYQVVRVLGRGSYGVVVLGEEPRRRQNRFAIKTISCEYLDADAAAKAKDEALAEAKLLRRLKHPHIVSCHDVCWDASRRAVWFALDYMDGGDIQLLISARRTSNEPPFEAAFVRRVLHAVGSALRYLHAQGVLHRDVKSSNILLARELRDIKLADFGISKILEATVNAHTVVGTPPYLSPELVSGEPYGPAADIWALGVCLYELAALRRPFDSDNQLGLAMQIVDQQPPELPSDTDAEIVRAVLGLLEKDAQKRLQMVDSLLPQTLVAPATSGRSTKSREKTMIFPAPNDVLLSP